MLFAHSTKGIIATKKSVRSKLVKTLYRRGVQVPNETQLSLLRESLDKWNKWRKENPDELIDLTKADLSGANLFQAYLIRASLIRASLIEANLSEAILSGAILSEVNLSGANISETILSEAILFQANLRGANLSDANLSGADLSGAKVDYKTSFLNALVNGCIVEQYLLERLADYGGLTKGDMMDMEIEDGVVTLRASYSGFMQWIHFIALGAFLFPYIWFGNNGVSVKGQSKS